MGLNSVQTREQKRAFGIRKFLNENVSIYQQYVPFNNVVVSLNNNVSLLPGYMNIKDKNGIPITEKKNVLKENLAADANTICTTVTAYAQITGDIELAYAVRYRTSDITKAKDGDVLTIIDGIYTAVLPLIGKPDFADYEITTDMLENLVRDAGTFTDDLGSAGVVDKSSSIANSNIDDVFAAIRGNISTMTLLLAHFQKKYPNFISGFHKNIAIDYSGMHHNGIFGVITNSTTGELLKKATVTLVGKKTTKVVESNDDGAYEITKCMTGKCKLIIATPGYDNQTIELTIIRGKSIELNIALRSQAVNIATA